MPEEWPITPRGMVSVWLSYAEKLNNTYNLGIFLSACPETDQICSVTYCQGFKMSLPHVSVEIVSCCLVEKYLGVGTKVPQRKQVLSPDQDHIIPFFI